MSVSKPGTFLVNISGKPTYWPKDVYHSIAKGLGSIDGQTLNCNISTNIDLIFDDVTVELTPNEYLNRTMASSTGMFFLNVSLIILNF